MMNDSMYNCCYRPAKNSNNAVSSNKAAKLESVLGAVLHESLSSQTQNCPPSFPNLVTPFLICSGGLTISSNLAAS